jgi:hypothetical protein
MSNGLDWETRKKILLELGVSDSLNINEFEEEIQSRQDSLKIINDIQAKEQARLNSIKAANANAVKTENSIIAFEESEKEKGDAEFQGRIAAVGGWDAIYDSLTMLEKGELQDSDTDFGIYDPRRRGGLFVDQETTTERPKQSIASHQGDPLTLGDYDDDLIINPVGGSGVGVDAPDPNQIKELEINLFGADDPVMDTWAPEFEGYLLNELNPIADDHHARKHPISSMFLPSPSTANKDPYQEAGFFEYSDPYKATHEYIKREMGQDAYDTLVAQAEQKFLDEKGFTSMEDWSKHELAEKRKNELAGLQNYSYRDKKNVLLPILEKLEKEAAVVEMQQSIVTQSNKVDPVDKTKSGANLQKLYEAQLDSIYQQSPTLQDEISPAPASMLIDLYNEQGYGDAGVPPEKFLKDQGLDY